MQICAENRDHNFLPSNIHTAFTGIAQHGITVNWATCDDDIRAAQRLRYEVFVVEMGAIPNDAMGDAALRLERDRFDIFCDHLIVRAPATLQQPLGAVIGTYRVLRPEQARLAGGFYCDTEFDLSPLDSLRSGTVELGRSCVHADWRSGSVVMMMWRALGAFMIRHKLHTMIGCASIWMGDNGAFASTIWAQLQHTHLVEKRWQIAPRFPLPLTDFSQFNQGVGHGNMRTPPLIKGYLRCGARLLGPPAHDQQFNTADLPMMMHFSEVTSRYRKHFLETHGDR